MDSSAVAALLGALIGGVATTIAAWLTQRGQLRRDAVERARAEAGRWTDDRRRIFREIHDTADEWAFLLRTVASHLRTGIPAGDQAVPDEALREVERRYHGLTFEVGMLCSRPLADAVERVEDEFHRLTVEFGRPTQYEPGAAPDAARAASRRYVDGERPELREARIDLLRSMRRELGLVD
jgi:hypothetical protein